MSCKAYIIQLKITFGMYFEEWWQVIIWSLLTIWYLLYTVFSFSICSSHRVIKLSLYTCEKDDTQIYSLVMTSLLLSFTVLVLIFVILNRHEKSMFSCFFLFFVLIKNSLLKIMVCFTLDSSVTGLMIFLKFMFPWFIGFID